MDKRGYQGITEYLSQDWTLTDRVGESIYHPCCKSWDREAGIPAILFWHDHEEDSLYFASISPSWSESQRLATNLRWAMEGYSRELDPLKLDAVLFVGGLVCTRQVAKINTPQPQPIHKVNTRFGRF